jgi:hypothetical protein
MVNKEYSFTLGDYQKGKFEIPQKEFIYYINNNDFYCRWPNLSTKILKIDKIDCRKLSYERIKGLFFKKERELLIPEGIKIVFLGYKNKSFDSMALIKKIFNSVLNNSKSCYVVVLGKGDYEISNEIVKDIPENVRFLFANNVNTEFEKVRYLPVGRDFRSADIFTEVKPKFIKNRLCYCNYSLTTHKTRELLYNSIKNKDFIEFDHMGKFLKYDISRLEYYKKVSESKFIICPRGNGIDTFRLWDSLYLGAIPIVVEEAVFHKSLYELPILFLESYEDFAKLNKEFLEEQYVKMINKYYNYKKLMFSYWINEIENC